MSSVIEFFKEVYYLTWPDLKFMQHNIRNILVSCLMTPILYLIAFGYGLNAGSITIDGHVVPYLDFVIPGIIALSSLSASFGATSARLNVQRLYYKSFDEMMMCPLGNAAIVVGKAFVGVVRGLLSTSLMFIIGFVLAPEYMHLNIRYVVTILLACFTFAMLGETAALVCKSHQTMATFSAVVVTPMTFLCGTFFSVANLPGIVQGLLYLLPLTEASVCIRAASLDIYAFPYWALAVLALFCIAFFSINYYLIKNRKI